MRQRRLAFEMRRLREQSELTREDIERETGINQATLYRLETGKVRPQRRTLDALLDLYGVPDRRRDEIHAYVRESGSGGSSRIVEPRLTDNYTSYISFEAEARIAINYEPMLVPGLLQTAEYAVAVVSGVGPAVAQHEAERRTNVRLRRQALLEDEDGGLYLAALIDESVLFREIGSPRILRGQLIRLVAADRKRNVSVRVVPFGAGAHPGLAGPYMLLEFPDQADPPVVYIESPVGQDVFLEEEQDIALFRNYTETLRTLALGSDESLRLIKSHIDRLGGGD